MRHQRQDPHELSNTVGVQAINLNPICRRVNWQFVAFLGIRLL